MKKIYLNHFISYEGTPMHVDPQVTDAFNALFQGHKWWVVLPKDLYEFERELNCDPICSDLVTYHNKKTLDSDQIVRLWYQHILPQIR